MPSPPVDEGAAKKVPSKAETRFRQAFVRLQTGSPVILPKGSRVSQNNVAREAGLDSTALRRSRFPGLVDDIQEWIDANSDKQAATSVRQQTVERRGRNKSLKIQLKERTDERDQAVSKLVDAHRHILTLLMKIQRSAGELPDEASVIELRSRRKKRS
ncbi:hypothetical protein SBC1_02990 [Caballeronia sp. SBC1]|uniref:hypothetical protein n=1 Tax=Caballeronia sp. SBC1 TaxID=2705548 RepID=UPI00140DF79D|nr:hypothetical protein [Caballeronia sp. SBC1]QIN60324.1 hypothetical protein SBC1_02990 [Caballeronia sp. SBC1]